MVAVNGLGCVMYTIQEAEETIKQACNLTPCCPLMENGAYVCLHDYIYLKEYILPVTRGVNRFSKFLLPIWEHCALLLYDYIYLKQCIKYMFKSIWVDPKVSRLTL